jgi:hypothetical protein
VVTIKVVRFICTVPFKTKFQSKGYQRARVLPCDGGDATEVRFVSS